jgi:hypothetical protein
MALNIMNTLDHGICQMPRAKVIIKGVAAATPSKNVFFFILSQSYYVDRASSRRPQCAQNLCDFCFTIIAPAGKMNQTVHNRVAAATPTYFGDSRTGRSLGARLTTRSLGARHSTILASATPPKLQPRFAWQMGGSPPKYTAPPS